MNMVKLYAGVESGRVGGADGNEYRIQNGVVTVPECCVADLEARGFKAAAKQPAEVVAAEQAPAPAVRKRTKK